MSDALLHESNRRARKVAQAALRVRLVCEEKAEFDVKACGEAGREYECALNAYEEIEGIARGEEQIDAGYGLSFEEVFGPPEARA